MPTRKPSVGTLVAALVLCFAAGGVQSEDITSNATGTQDGFYYSFWKDSGEVSFGLEAGGRYTSQWNKVNNWVGGKGWKPGGPRLVNYTGSFNVSRSQNAYLALYGWTKDPLVEYYVVESYGSYNPASCSDGQDYGSYQSDGATYNIRRCQRVNQPSIEGTQTFYQYFSVRSPIKGYGAIKGSINMATHFDAWKKVGLNLGTHDYMILATEGYRSTGSSDITVTESPSPAATPVATHGALAVKGNQIVGADGKPVSLAGPSLFWSNTGWGEDQYYNANVIAYLRKDWNAGIVRAAIGADSKGGYAADPEGNFAKAERVIDAAIAQGIYVIVDWHAHDAEKNPALAISFFEKIARKYGKSPNLIYEIYNEPLQNVDWSRQIKPYAEQVIAKIRALDPDNLIVVGTQTWSQDVDKAAADPIQGFGNIAYSLHFYAGTHKQGLRDKAQKALDQGIALMITEWGSVNANGDGDIDKKETELWLAFARKNNLSICNWALSDKQEGASQLKHGTPADGKWTDANLTEAGLFVKDIVLRWEKAK